MNSIAIVDICNTLADINSELRKRGYDTEHYPSVIPPHVWKDKEIFSEAAPIEPIVYFVQRLAQVARIVYLTARPNDCQLVTSRWLKKHRLPEGPIIFTKGRPKGEYVSELVDDVTNSVIVLEDSPQEIESILAVNPNVHLVIPAWSYNSHIEGNRIAF